MWSVGGSTTQTFRAKQKRKPKQQALAINKTINKSRRGCLLILKMYPLSVFVESINIGIEFKEMQNLQGHLVNSIVLRASPNDLNRT
jgi:hypothetical protein